MKTMNLIGGGYFNYLVSFSDGTFKTGITKNPFCRLQDFVQEAHRHSVKVNGFEITKPVKSKKLALRIETAFCNWFALDAIEGHREWFKEDLSWADEDYLKIHSAVHNPRDDFEFRFYYLSELRNRFVPFYIPLANISIKEYLKNRRAINSKFIELQNLASELGRLGARIKAGRATRMANEILCQVLS